MQNWKQTAAAAIVTTPVAVLDPLACADDQTAAALRERIQQGSIAERDLSFAQSLLRGFDRYGAFTDKQRPHARRLAEATPAAPVEGPDAALAASLEAALPNVALNDREFAQSLVSGFKRYGSFTDRQRPHVERLVKNAKAHASFVAAPQEPAKPAQTLCPNICATVNLGKFSRFTVGNLQLSLKNDGSVIWVKWMGKIAGSIDPATTAYRATYRYLTHNALAQALDALLKVEADPLAAARENGVLTGRCSCCGRPLTDPTSIEFGIGPICRERGFGVMI